MAHGAYCSTCNRTAYFDDPNVGACPVCSSPLAAPCWRHRNGVLVARTAKLDWMVWVDGNLVRQFMVLSDALAYASVLEYSPRERAAALTVASRAVS